MQIPFALLLALCSCSLFATDWPGWRGPADDGSTPDLPRTLSWDRTNNVAWRLALPEPGNSSPVVSGKRVFLTQAAGQRRTLLCVDRGTGTILWQAGPAYELPEETMKENNPYCSASPITDGERVIAFFGSAGLFCYDLTGRELWSTNLGSISHPFGTASSPALHGDLCYVYVGPGEKQSLVAVRKRTGEIAWRTETLKPNAVEAAKISTNGPPVGSWSTPLMISVGGRDELIMAYAFRWGGYDPRSGELLWQRGGLGLQVYVTPLWTDGMLIAVGGTTTYAIRPPATEGTRAKARSEPEVVWTQEKGKFRFGSGVTTERHLYFLAENGLAECWDKATGKVLWQERLVGPGKKNTTWSSLSKAGDRIFAPNQSGDVFVFAAAPTFHLLSTNSISEPTNASLALSDGEVFMRTDRALWCFDQKQSGSL